MNRLQRDAQVLAALRQLAGSELDLAVRAHADAAAKLLSRGNQDAQVQALLGVAQDALRPAGVRREAITMLVAVLLSR